MPITCRARRSSARAPGPRCLSRSGRRPRSRRAGFGTAIVSTLGGHADRDHRKPGTHRRLREPARGRGAAHRRRAAHRRGRANGFPERQPRSPLRDVAPSASPPCPAISIVYPGHDYAGHTHSTLAQERADESPAAARRSRRIRLGPARRATGETRQHGRDRHGQHPRRQAVASDHGRGAWPGPRRPNRRSWWTCGCPRNTARCIWSRACRAPGRDRAAPRRAAARSGARARLSHGRPRAPGGRGAGRASRAGPGRRTRRLARGGTPRRRGHSPHEPGASGPIAAGALACAGGVLAVAVSPWFGLLPAFVGAGLVYAGVTDRCGMAMLLGKLPYNRRGADGGTCAAPSEPRRVPRPCRKRRELCGPDRSVAAIGRFRSAG